MRTEDEIRDERSGKFFRSRLRRNRRICLPSIGIIFSAIIGFTLLKKEVRGNFLAKFEETF